MLRIVLTIDLALQPQSLYLLVPRLFSLSSRAVLWTTGSSRRSDERQISQRCTLLVHMSPRSFYRKRSHDGCCIHRNLTAHGRMHAKHFLRPRFYIVLFRLRDSRRLSRCWAGSRELSHTAERCVKGNSWSTFWLCCHATWYPVLPDIASQRLVTELVMRYHFHQACSGGEYRCIAIRTACRRPCIPANPKLWSTSYRGQQMTW